MAQQFGGFQHGYYQANPLQQQQQQQQQQQVQQQQAQQLALQQQQLQQAAQQHAQHQQQHAQQQQGQGAGGGQIDPALLQSLYPQAFQALAFQQQLQLMTKAQQQQQAQQAQQAQHAAAAAAAAAAQQRALQQAAGGVLPNAVQAAQQAQQMQIYQAALAASFPGGMDNPLLQQFHQESLMRQLAQQAQMQQQQAAAAQAGHQLGGVGAGGAGSSSARDKGADAYDDDYEDDDEDYEDDDSPRRRRKFKQVFSKPVAPPAPKPPKGAPRVYVVCKTCPSCKLSVGNNTRICRGCGHNFSTRHHSHTASASHHLSTITPTPQPTYNPDGTLVEPRKSTRKRVKANHQAATDFLDKDEAAHLQIALANSLVETKGGAEPQTSHCKEAPEFRPSVSEWSNPMAYIRKIREDAEAYGIAKIIPPAGWKPPNVLKQDFKFPTRLQPIHRLTEAIGFEAGRHYTPSEYEAMSEAFKAKWVSERNAKTGSVGQPSEEEIEQAYWKIVETAQPPTEVEYGNDISNVVAGGHGAFEPASAELDPKNYAGAPAWNLNLIPHAEGSVLKSLPQQIQGITEPWLYMGTMFATFCWHAEDDYLYSMNYLHRGASKVWYSIPAKRALQFEKVMQRTLAQLVLEEPDLHLKLVTMVPPSLLHSHNVPVYRTVQEAGSFIVTFPKAHHAGFSLGFNVAEAVNFATDDWFKFGREAAGRYKKYMRGSVLSVSQLLFDCILNTRWQFNVDILRDELLHLYETELKGRKIARDQGVTRKIRLDVEKLEPANQEMECAKCRIPLYLSFVACPCILEHQHIINPPRTRLPDEPPQQPTTDDAAAGNHSDQQQPQQDDQQHAHQHEHEQHHHDDSAVSAAAAAASAHHEHQHHFGEPIPHEQHNNQQEQQEQPQQQQGPLLDEHGQPLPEQAASEPPPPPEPRYSGLCLCECQHQTWCLDHVRYAKGALNTDYGGEMPVLFFRRVLPELVAMDEILAQAPTADELAGKVTATQLLKERTANIDLDKDELPPTPPPPTAAEFESLDAAAAVAAAAEPTPVVKPKVKKERKRRVRHESEDDDDYELNPNEEPDDDDSDDDNPPITFQRHPAHHATAAAAAAVAAGYPVSAQQMAAMGYGPIQHPAMMMQHHGGGFMATPQSRNVQVQPRSQPKRAKRDTIREDLKDAYVNLDLVELDEVPGFEDDEDDISRVRPAAAPSVDINPQVQQALSAIVEAIAEVSSMSKHEEEGPAAMELEQQQQQQHTQAAVAAAAAAAHAAAAHAQAQQQIAAGQLGLTPQQYLQVQLAQQQHVMQQQQGQQYQQAMRYQQQQQMMQQQQQQQRM